MRGLGAAVFCCALFLAACASQRVQPAATGVAYPGPPSVTLHKDLASRSPVVGTVHHGERLDVLETRRRFVRVRTGQGVEGWTDANLLLTPQQMDDLRRLAASAAKLPSQGAATAFDTLNIHTDPNRQSPSFFQIAESTPLEVIGHQIAPRISALPAVPVHRAAPRKTRTKEPKKPVLPPPLPPPLPLDWQALSRPRAPDLPDYRPPEEKPVPVDDWSLVRTKDGNTGWVLSRMLSMSVPDEVAQYAEGHRITAYLPLGEVKDKENGAIKSNWLWTTISSGSFPYEFDSFRVFVWSVRRHRYETAYIERNVKGYYPVTTEDLPGDDEKAFSVVLQDKDGKLYKRIYAFSGYRVRMVSKTPYVAPPPLPVVHATRDFEPLAPPPARVLSWRQKLGQWRRRLF
ncbi:MAG TPA: hypothetical protein VMG40_05865 [Bryobacteraceae bacterium]|nr:hypothetical protein [Bryobacteraceae bacterium]